MIRAGIVGCGGIVERRHLPGLLERSDAVQVCALADVSPDRLSLLAARANLSPGHCYADFRDMLAGESLDLLVVATPHAFHEAPVLAAAGKVPTIITEKPLTADLPSAERMIQAAEQAGTALGVVHNQLYRPAVETATEILRRGEIGEPFLYRVESLGPSHVVGRGIEQNWRTQSVRGGGGCLIDNGYHNVYVAEKLVGAPVVSVQGIARTYVHAIDVEDTALVFLHHANGATTSLQTAWSVVAGRGVAQGVNEIHATRGSICFEHSGRPVSVFRPGQAEPDWPDVIAERPDDYGYYAFRDQLLGALATGGALPVTGRDAYHILAVIEAAYEAARSGLSVEVVA